jgi:Na+/H+ antiporter NhaD/arsenite permease-like protein
VGTLLRQSPQLATSALIAQSHFTGSFFGITALVLFVLAYALVVTEDLVRLRKSKPVIIAAGLIWVCVALAFHAASMQGLQGVVDHHNLPDEYLEDRGKLLVALVMHHVAYFGALFLFLIVAMTYISAIAERNVFVKINAWLVSAGFGFRMVFWATGALAFFISSMVDNLTTALLMGTVVVTVGGQSTRFVALACTNVVVAANAGGASSPLGDVTTFMVWQGGKVQALEFMAVIVPSLVCWLVPATVMFLFVPKEQLPSHAEEVELKTGWWVVIMLFLLTIATAVSFHVVLHLPPFLGMTTGLGYFFIYGFLRRMRETRMRMVKPLDVMENVAKVDWDTVLFFCGVIMCVGGLSELGYLELCSGFLYDNWGAYQANISVGLISAIIDNVPVMATVLTMDPAAMSPDVVGPEMARFHWLLVTLTAIVGGSLLSVGSAAGVALMGIAHGQYSFTAHLRWSPAILLGYAAAICAHHLLNYPVAK